MNREEFFYLLPYLFSLALSLGIFFYAWGHRQVRGVRAYTWFVAGQILVIIAFLLELVSPNLQTKLLWDRFQWLADSYFIILPFLIFSVQFSEHKFQHPVIHWGIVTALLLTFTVLLITDDIHHLLYPNPHLSTDIPFPELQYDFTTAVYAYVLLYVYGVNLYGIGLLVKRALQPYNSYRLQYWTIVAGFMIPLVFTVLSLLDIKIAPQRDITPLTLAAGNAVVAWGIFRYKLFELVPIARENIVENMIDPVVVLDLQNRVVDLNRAALTLLGKQSPEVIGQTSEVAFSRWPFVVELLDNVQEQRREVSAKSKGDTIFFDINISPIRSKRNRLLGRIVVARDITRHKDLEMNYRALSEELEQRVHERTEELRESAERYRAVIENQTEFIVRWKPDRTRTFVNDAYCRNFGLTLEQAMQIDFMTLIAEEDRPPVEAKIKRLTSGESEAETEIHRVIKPDGSIGWQEWTDHAIRDEAGKVVEFQSVGRDITERKRAEDEIRKLSLAVEQSNTSIVITNTSGNIEYVNRYFSELTGYISDEVIGKNPSIMKSGITGNDVYDGLWKTITDGKEWQGEFCNRKKNGELYWESAFISPIVDSAGTVTHFVAVKTDITERKQVEEALRKSEERFSKAFRASPIIITISQLSNARLIEVNETFERISGYTREEVIGKTTFDLGFWVNPADRDRILTAILATGEIRSEEIQYRIKDGSILTCLLSGDLIELGGEKCILATIEDISERKMSEERILRLNRLYVTISQINQTIVHARDRDSLFSEICRVATDHGQFRMAWIGLINGSGVNIEPMVFAGEELGYLANIKVNHQDRVTGSGPTGTAIREDHCIICQDIATDPRMDPWREMALSRGYRSSAAVPLREHGQVIGALTVYAGEPHGFDSENEELLEQIGLDVSFALDSIDAQVERDRAEENLAEAYDTTLEGWAKALELRDKETEGHSRRVTETTLAVARAMGFSEQELTQIRRGSILHDIGKMGIPDDILRKNGPLTNEEKAIVVKHPNTAYELLKPIAYLEQALDIPYCHHEKWDGSGYPRGLKGEEIPLSARIFAVVDVWDALCSDRPYREAWSQEKVANYLIDESGKHFDPNVVNVFLQMVEKGGI